MTALPIMDASSLWILSVAAFVAGGIASIAGFGIGSVLTPTLSVWVDAQARGRRDLDSASDRDRAAILAVERRASIAACCGASASRARPEASPARCCNAVFTSPALLTLLAVLLLFVAAGELTGFSRRIVFRGPAAWIAGALSGALGGLVGNQGGLRSAALLGFRMDARYVCRHGHRHRVDRRRRAHAGLLRRVCGRAAGSMATPIAVTIAGVVVGTVAGGRILRRIPETCFRRIVAILLAVLGICAVGARLGARLLELHRVDRRQV